MFGLRTSHFEALQRQLNDHEVEPDSLEKAEFTPIGQGQPWNILKFLITNAMKLKPEQVLEIEEVAEQVSVPREICDMADEKLKGSGLSDYVDVFKEFIYDPSAAVFGALQYVQMGRVFKFNEKSKKVNLQFFKQLVKIALLAVLVAGLWEFTSPHIFENVVQYITAFSGIVIAGLIWKVVQILQEFMDMSKFGLSEISRIRLSLGTGNIVQLLMRIVGKAEYIEKRSAKIFGHSHVFWREVEEEVGKVEWHDHQCGYDHLEGIILEFMARKFMHSGSYSRVKDKVIRDIKEDLIKIFGQLASDRAAESGRSANNDAHLRFLLKVRDEKIEEIWSKYGYWREEAEIIWKA